jgi:hypothetical protein
VAQEAIERDEAIRRKEESDRLQSRLERKRADLEDKIAGLRRDFQTEEAEIQLVLDQAHLMEVQQEQDRMNMARSRRVDPAGSPRRKGVER